jgi:hypothetical protein
MKPRLEEEILGPPQNRKLTMLALIASIAAAAIFFVLAARFNQSPFLLQKPISRTIPLKLSPDDLLALNQNMNTNVWIGVKWVEAKGQQRKIKLRHLKDSVFDFQMLVGDTIFNLFEFNRQREQLYDLFLKAGTWGIETLPVQLVQLTINEVQVGIYLMEEYVYRQIRDQRGDYYISLGTDSRWMREFHYRVQFNETTMLRRYFELVPLARHLVFFSFFSYRQPLDYRPLLLRYDADLKKFRPVLTITSVVEGLQERNLEFDIRVLNNWNRYSSLTRRIIEDLLQRAGEYRYPRLLKIVLEHVLERMDRQAPL